MFCEFFCRADCRTLLAAWVGLAVVLGYSVFLAHVKMQLNQWYSDFYDLLQQSSAALVAVNASSSCAGDLGSGFIESEPVALDDLRARVWEELQSFAWIVAPLVWASPAAKWTRSAWAFAWRAALMRAYLRVWDVTKEPVEGASQRLHEDSQRFSNALQGCLATALDALFTLGVFAPVLLKLSRDVPPPVPVGPIRDAWLLVGALLAASIGLAGALLFGRALVSLEVNNQRLEASLRKDLVLLETTPAVIVGAQTSDQTYAPCEYFYVTLQRLSSNYHTLFRHFTLLNLWLSFFDQVMVLAPYVVAAPLLFADDPADRITLGTLMQISNSFDKVFASMNTIAESWGQINEFRSVLVRLREFESKIYLHVPDSARRRGDNTPRCWLLPPDGGSPTRHRHWWTQCLPRRAKPQWSADAARIEPGAPASSDFGTVAVHELTPTYGAPFAADPSDESLRTEQL
jgi:peptide/bleomycin uptake transporter